MLRGARVGCVVSYHHQYAKRFSQPKQYAHIWFLQASYFAVPGEVLSSKLHPTYNSLYIVPVVQSEFLTNNGLTSMYLPYGNYCMQTKQNACLPYRRQAHFLYNQSITSQYSSV